MRALIPALLLAVTPAWAGPRVVADPRFELMAVLRRLADGGEVPGLKARADHPAVEALRGERGRALAGVIFQYAPYLSAPPELEEVLPVPDHFADRAGGREGLRRWRADASSFARESGYARWYAARADAREELAAGVRRALEGRDLEAAATAYLGLRPWSEWTLVVSDLHPDGVTAAWVVEEAQGLPPVFVVVGPPPGRRAWTALSLAEGVWDEPLFAAAYAAYELCRPAMRPAPDACRGSTQSEPEDCVQQIWVRAVVARLLAREFGDAAEALSLKRAPSPRMKAVREVLLARERLADRGDLLDWAARLAAPFQKDGKAPSCPLYDHSRYDDSVYLRRLDYALRARNEARPDPALAKELKQIRFFREETGP